MKNVLLTLVVLMAFAYHASAQHKSDIRLNGYAVDAFSDKVDSYYSSTDYFNGTINGGLQWGAGIEIKPVKMTGIEFLYNRLDTKSSMTYYSGGG